MEEAGSYRIPSVEHARVRDAMNKAIVTCTRDAGLREMGRLMAGHHIHSLVMSLGRPGAVGGSLGRRHSARRARSPAGHC
jgi:hypothetical protein